MKIDIYSQFAQADFSCLINSFVQAGFSVTQPLAGVLQICSVRQDDARMRLLISVGVHGDELTPIHMMALLLQQLSAEPRALAVDLMLVIGNLPAILQYKRFIQADLNRLFSPQRLISAGIEAERANQLMQVAAQFFEGRSNKRHLDLHSAIRSSVYPTFAIIPGADHCSLLGWLAEAGIAAVVLSSQSGSATFSAFTHLNLGVTSCTIELGSIGQVNVSHFAATQAAITHLLRSGLMHSSHKDTTSLAIFRTQYELIKQSDAFEFVADPHIQNFAQLAPKTMVARDGDQIWLVGEEPEYILFPNPDVQVGLRAGVMMVRTAE